MGNTTWNYTYRDDGKLATLEEDGVVARYEYTPEAGRLARTVQDNLTLQSSSYDADGAVAAQLFYIIYPYAGEQWRYEPPRPRHHRRGARA